MQTGCEDALSHHGSTPTSNIHRQTRFEMVVTGSLMEIQWRMCFASVIWVFDSIASNLHVYYSLGKIRWSSRSVAWDIIGNALLSGLQVLVYKFFVWKGWRATKRWAQGKEAKGCLGETSKIQGHLRSWSKTFEEQVSNICNPSHGSLSLKVLCRRQERKKSKKLKTW